MTVFLDTGVVVAYCNQGDARHTRTKGLMEAIRSREYGVPFSSDYVFDEAVTLALARTGRGEVAVSVGDLLLPAAPDERFVNMVHTSGEEAARAWAAMREHVDAGLSFTDWVTVEQVHGRRIDLVASFDRRLDAWVQRIE